MELIQILLCIFLHLLTHSLAQTKYTTSITISLDQDIQGLYYLQKFQEANMQSNNKLSYDYMVESFKIQLTLADKLANTLKQPVYVVDCKEYFKNAPYLLTADNVRYQKQQKNCALLSGTTQKVFFKTVFSPDRFLQVCVSAGFPKNKFTPTELGITINPDV